MNLRRLGYKGMERKRFLPSEDKFSQSIRIVYGDGPTLQELNQLRSKKLLTAYALHFCQEFAKLFTYNLYLARPYIDYIGEVQQLSAQELAEEKIRETQYDLSRATNK